MKDISTSEFEIELFLRRNPGLLQVLQTPTGVCFIGRQGTTKLDGQAREKQIKMNQVFFCFSSELW